MILLLILIYFALSDISDTLYYDSKKHDERSSHDEITYNTQVNAFFVDDGRDQLDGE